MERQTPILEAPNEILLKIFDHLIVPERPYQLTWPLALTCKRFSVLAQPIIWSHISLQNDDCDEEPPYQTVGVTARNKSRKTRKCLEIAPAAATSHVKHVSLLGSGEIGFRDAIDVIQRYPNLQRLDLESVTNISRIWDDSSARGQRFVSESAEVAAPPPGLEGSVGLQELHLGRFKYGTPDALRNFLSWPTALRVFSLDELASELEDWDYLLQWENCCKWTYQMIADVLSCHAKTLRFLRIRQIGRETLENFNVNNFIALETLELCAGSVLSDPSVAFESWALPNLKRLAINCSRYTSLDGVKPIFNHRIEQWLQEFATLIASRRECDRVALQHIEIIWYTDSTHWEGFPNDEKQKMENTKQHIEECGLEASITYTNRYAYIDEDGGFFHF